MLILVYFMVNLFGVFVKVDFLQIILLSETTATAGGHGEDGG